MRGRALLAAAAGFVACLSAASPVWASEPIDPSRLAAVDNYLAGARTEIGIPGLAAVFVSGDSIVHLTALGEADPSGRRVTPQTPFLLASTSKAFTALAVMQLAEAGKLDLDAPVKRYLPWFLADSQAADRITLRMLLRHTSGLSPASGQAYHDSDDQDAGALERMVRGLASSTLIAEPGAAHHYTNTGYDILGLIVQTVSGEPFSQYVEGHIFAPLDMRHSHVTLEAAQQDGLAAGYYHWFGVSWQPAPIPRPRAGGASATMFVSAEDLGHEIAAHLNGGSYGGRRVLSEAGIETLHTPGVKVDDFHSYAMGWVVRPLWEALDATKPSAQAFKLPALVEHSGEWADGHSYVGLVPSETWGFGLLVNSWDFAAGSRFSLLEQNVLRLLEGHEPLADGGGTELLAQNGRLVGALLLLAELASLAWSARVLLHARRDRAAIRARRIAIGTAFAVGLDVLVVWLFVVYVPDHFESTVGALLRESPDLMLMDLPALGLAVVWGPVRTVLLAWILAKDRATRRAARPLP